MREAVAEIELGEATPLVQPAQNAIAGGAGAKIIAEGVGLGCGVGAIGLLGAFLSIGAALLAPAHATAVSSAYWSNLGLLQLVGGVIGMKIGEQIGARRYYRQFLKGLRERGTPERLVTRYLIGEDALRVETGRMSYAASWPSILQLFHGPAHWLIQTDTVTFILPKSAFAAPDDQEAFLRELATRLSPAARERSHAALERASASAPV